jgi:hypothetical protein
MSAREVGELVASVGAGPVHQLTERAPSLEETYLQLAGTLATPAVSSAGRPA